MMETVKESIKKSPEALKVWTEERKRRFEDPEFRAEIEVIRNKIYKNFRHSCKRSVEASSQLFLKSALKAGPAGWAKLNEVYENNKNVNKEFKRRVKRPVGAIDPSNPKEKRAAGHRQNLLEKLTASSVAG